MLTQHNDVARTGANLSEITLTTANVNADMFGKLYELPVDGDVYAQPLYVPNRMIPGAGVHDVVYVATMHNSVYAFDANSNSGHGASQLWAVNLGTPVPIEDVQLYDRGIRLEVGVLSTPVIDPSAGTIYVLSRTRDAQPVYHQMLHALDITTGAERSGSPVEIRGSVLGTGAGSSGGRITFDPKIHNQRAALLLLNGTVYIAWASHDDTGNYHGWVMGYDARTLAQTAIFNDTPNGSAGGIWQAGSGIASDGTNLYVMTGNGTFDGGAGIPADTGLSVLQLSPTLQVTSYFTPHNQTYLNDLDLDLGSAGPMVLPGTGYLVGGGKEGRIYLMSQSNLGGYNTTADQVVDTFQASPLPSCDPTCPRSDWIAYDHIHGAPVYWSSPNHGPMIYVWAEKDFLRAYQFVTNRFIHTSVMMSTMQVPVNAQGHGMPGGFLSLSANGSTPGSGILWASHPFSATGSEVDTENTVVTGILRAFDASNLSNELWSTQRLAARDDFGNFAKFASPTVANGKVYLPTFSNKVAVYGRLYSGRWNLDQGSGTVASDTSGGGHPATLSNSGATWTSGISGTALAFDGTTGFADAGAPVVDTSRSYTVATWVRLDDVSGWRTFVSQDGTNISGFFLQKDAGTGNFGFTVLGSDSTAATRASAQSTTAPVAGRWYHVAGVYDQASAQLRIYVNGQFQGSAPFTTPWYASGHTVFGRGLYGGPTDFTRGAVDEVRAYARSLRDAEILALYQEGAGLWRLDEDSGTLAADATGHGHGATLVGGSGWVLHGVKGAAVTLDGATGYVDTGAAVLDTTQSYTVAAWVRLNAVGGWQTILSQDGTNISAFFLQKDANTGRFALSALASDSTAAVKSSAQSTTTPVASVWYHVVGVYDRTAGQLRIYVNGALQGTAAYTAPWAAAGHLVFGRGRYSGGPVDFVNGAIDDVRAYGHALADADILALYQDGAAAAWSFDDNLGVTAADSTNEGSGGTLNGGATWTAGHSGSAVALDGVTGFVDCTRAVLDTSASFTVTTWVRLTSANGWQTFVSQDGVNVSGFFLQKDANTGRFAMSVLASDATGAAKASAQSTTVPVTGTWYHLAAVQDRAAGQLRLYVNGVLEGSATSSAEWVAGRNLEIGRGRFGSASVDFVAGTIDQTRVFTRALSDADVQALYAAGG